MPEISYETYKEYKAWVGTVGPHFYDALEITGDTLVRWEEMQGSLDQASLGTLSTVKKTVTSGYGIDDETDQTIFADATTGDLDIDLPSAIGIPGQEFSIKKIDSTSHAVNIVPSGAQTIDGENPLVLMLQYESVRIKSDGANWWVM